ncbi:MAG: response regulator transcription factor [Ignavibacteriales bacterium]|nr:response regulator transcription factor [Ignavibacteriales bacterium]
MIRVLIADDHVVVRHGLRKILGEHSDMSVVGEANNATEALALAQNTKADVLLLDITMPDKSGLDILKDLKRAKPKLPVLILSMHPEAQFAVRVLRAGGSGYLTKDAPPEELARAIRKVATGGKYVGSLLAEQLASMTEANIQRPPHEKLSDREFQVLRLIAQGKTLTEIAAILALSVKTISTYRARILDKMNMKSNAEIARYTVEHKLIE